MLKSNKDPKNIADVSKIFSKLMGKQNINGTLKLFTNNMTNDILRLDEKTLKSLKQKHL